MLLRYRQSYLFVYECAFLSISYRLLLVSATDATREVPNRYSYDFKVTSVKRCPMNKTEHEEAEARLGCSGDQGYHCTPDKYHLNLIEFCYTKKRILVHTGNCLELAHIGILNHVKCQNFSCGCPEKPYFSNEIYMYPACLSLAFECFTSDKTCLREKSTMRPCEKIDSKQDIDSKEEEINVFMVLFIITASILIVLGVLAFILKRKNILVFGRETKRLKDNTDNTVEKLLPTSTCTNDANETIPLYARNQTEEISGTSSTSIELTSREGKLDNVTSVIRNEEDVPILQQNSRDTSIQVKEPPRIDLKFKIRSGLQSRGFNALHSAARDGNVDRFKETFEIFTKVKTIESGVDSRTKDGRNCLHIAAYFGHHDICEYILSKRKTLFESKDSNKMNPAHWAALAGKTDILELMLEYGCDIHEKTNPYEENIVLFACSGNKLEVCKFAEKNCPDLLHAKNREGWNSIQYAAKRGYLEIFDFLYNNMVDIKSKSHKTDKNCLYSACEYGHVAVVDYILSREPELVNERDKFKQHVGIFAAKSENSDILSVLLTKTNMDFLKKATSQKINILHVACKYANLDFCIKLKEMHILQDLCQEITEKGWNAALFITERSTNEDKRIQILELLAEDDWLDVYHVSRAGKTILYNACVNQSKKLVKYLLDHYPDLDGIERGLDPIRAAESEEISAIFERHRRAEISKRGAFFSRFRRNQ